ncbi:MAG TPA: hypothetical protein VGP93_01585 [Polyangiaceae bacterium]|nr:hypothetical protein [Polyangiaceae bacterium]
MARLRASSLVGIGFAVTSIAWFVGCGSDDTSTPAHGGATGGGTGGTTGGTFGTGGLMSVGGAAGITGGGSGGIPAVDVCLTKLAVESATILDYEDGTTGDMTTVGMYTYGEPGADAVPPGNGGTISPLPDMVDTGLITTDGANGTSNSYKFTGTGFKAMSWGGGFGIWLTCIDASTVDGVKFYYKSDQALTVSIPIPANVTNLQQGECQGDFNTCKQWSSEIPAAAAWTEVSIVWADLMGGMPAAFDNTEVIGIGFAIVVPTAAADGWGWNVSLDEVEWIGGPVGTGGATGNGGAANGGGGGA